MMSGHVLHLQFKRAVERGYKQAAFPVLKPPVGVVFQHLHYDKMTESFELVDNELSGQAITINRSIFQDDGGWQPVTHQRQGGKKLVARVIRSDRTPVRSLVAWPMLEWPATPRSGLVQLRIKASIWLGSKQRRSVLLTYFDCRTGIRWRSRVRTTMCRLLNGRILPNEQHC